MKSIFKYPLVGEKLESDGRFEVVVNMPCEPKLIRVAVQKRDMGGVSLKPIITLWAEVETSNDLEDHTFWLIGTGRELPKGCSYIDTVEIGDLVWHVYGPKP